VCEVLVQIIVYIDFIKHPLFESERELRIIMNPNNSTLEAQNIRYYQRGQAEVPYLLFDLRDPLTGRLPLAEIIVGPNATVPGAIALVEGLLDETEYGSCVDSDRPKVVRSLIPPWGCLA
jgi:hypothetical protein